MMICLSLYRSRSVTATSNRFPESNVAIAATFACFAKVAAVAYPSPIAITGDLASFCNPSTDPAPGTEDKLRNYVKAAWSALTKIGLAPGASTTRLRFTADLKEAIADADLVQENAPEREPLKVKLFADMDSILPPPAILASSTSGIPMSRIQSECKHPERCVTGHPFNDCPRC